VKALLYRTVALASFLHLDPVGDAISQASLATNGSVEAENFDGKVTLRCMSMNF